MARKVEAVFFDMGGTLVYDAGFRDALAESLLGFLQRNYSFNLGREDVLKVWEKTGFWYKDLEMWDLVRSMFFLRELGLTPKPQIAENLYGAILEAYVRGFQLEPSAKSVLENLKSRGVLIGIITNVGSYDIVSRRLREAGLLEYVDVLVASQAVAWKKPAQEIFWVASQLAGVEASKCVHVGDDPQADIEGSKLVGFKAIQVLKYARSESPIADARVHSLAEVPQVIEAWLSSR